MKLSRSPQLDALCGEHLLGTLRGPARRRFERALRDDPLVALRYQYWQQLFALRYSNSIATQPSASVWSRLSRELDLQRYRVPWFRRLGIWRIWAGLATAALILALSVNLLLPRFASEFTDIAQLVGEDKNMIVTAAVSADRKLLTLRALRPVVAGPSQSYELWLLPASGEAPISLAVLGQLDARFTLPAPHGPRILAGARFAVSVEPAGGSPSGAPTGPIILVGAIKM
ncbi:MAG: anti-sigma factor [Burkholderiales bacterium]